MEDHYDLTIGEIQLQLPIIHTPEISFYSFNMMGEAALNRTCAQELYNKTKDHIPEVLLTAEAKAIGLAENLAKLYGHSKYIVLRKSKKSYMTAAVGIEGSSITSGANKFWIEKTDLEYLRDKTIGILDDVISTGGTMKVLKDVCDVAQGRVMSILVACTEGEAVSEWNNIPIYSCGNFPLP